MSRDLSLTRTASDFVAVFVDRLAAAMAAQSALVAAVGAVRGRPGAPQLEELVDGARRRGWVDTAEAVGELGRQWCSPVLESLAVALRCGDDVRAPMREYLLACATAEATR